MTAAVACRTAVAGAQLELLVLTAGGHGCAAVDLASGAFVRPRWSGTADLTPFTVAVGEIALDQPVADASRPEAVLLTGPPQVVGRMRRRQAERYLRPLQHPKGRPLLDLPGPAAPYWTLTGDRPSVALVVPETAPRIVRWSEGLACRFGWSGLPHQLPLTPSAAHRVPRRANALLVALSAPRNGHCHKVVAAVL